MLKKVVYVYVAINLYKLLKGFCKGMYNNIMVFDGFL